MVEVLYLLSGPGGKKGGTAGNRPLVPVVGIRGLLFLPERGEPKPLMLFRGHVDHTTRYFTRRDWKWRNCS